MEKANSGCWGKALGILHKRGLTREQLKPEWRNPFLCYFLGEGRPQLLLQLTVSKGWTVFDIVLQKAIPGASAVALRTELME